MAHFKHRILSAMPWFALGVAMIVILIVAQQSAPSGGGKGHAIVPARPDGHIIAMVLLAVFTTGAAFGVAMGKLTNVRYLAIVGVFVWPALLLIAATVFLPVREEMLRNAYARDAMLQSAEQDHP